MLRSAMWVLGLLAFSGRRGAWPLDTPAPKWSVYRVEIAVS